MILKNVDVLRTIEIDIRKVFILRHSSTTNYVLFYQQEKFIKGLTVPAKSNNQNIVVTTMYVKKAS